MEKLNQAVAALEWIIDHIPVNTAIGEAHFLPPPCDNEYALCRLRCAHLGFKLTEAALAAFMFVTKVQPDELVIS